MAYCFISDLHLQEDRPDITQAFIGFLDTTAKEAERLYILGDLFEAWIGDDLKTELSLIIKEKLSLLNDSSTIIFAMHGNRDFLIGEKFCEDTGITLLDDPCKLELFGKALFELILSRTESSKLDTYIRAILSNIFSIFE